MQTISKRNGCKIRWHHKFLGSWNVAGTLPGCHQSQRNVKQPIAKHKQETKVGYLLVPNFAKVLTFFPLVPSLPLFVAGTIKTLISNKFQSCFEKTPLRHWSSAYCTRLMANSLSSSSTTSLVIILWWQGWRWWWRSNGPDRTFWP